MRALKAGAVDFLSKSVTRETLLETVQRAIVLNSERRTNRLELVSRHARFDTLTPREREILELLFDGQLNKLIAFTLNVCEHTAKSERTQIMRKLDRRFRPPYRKAAATVRK